jgi:hypothetical protein
MRAAGSCWQIADAAGVSSDCHSMPALARPCLAARPSGYSAGDSAKPALKSAISLKNSRQFPPSFRGWFPHVRARRVGPRGLGIWRPATAKGVIGMSPRSSSNAALACSRHAESSTPRPLRCLDDIAVVRCCEAGAAPASCVGVAGVGNPAHRSLPARHAFAMKLHRAGADPQIESLACRRSTREGAHQGSWRRSHY